jgi:hypothetical protein
MGRRRYGRRRGRGGFKIPIVSLAILGGQAMLANASGGDIGSKLGKFASFYTGLDLSGAGGTTPTFQPAALLVGYGPWLVKRFVGRIAGARIPMKGLPISIS